MKHQFILGLALFAAVLLWPGCDDEVVPPSCEFDLPTVPFSDGNCSPNALALDALGSVQAGSFPDLPYDCVTGDFGRVVRLNPSSDGELTLHLYVGIPATINYQVFGADCDSNITPLTSCVSSSAVAISQTIDDGSDYEDIYVRIDYDIFASPRYAGYIPQQEDFIGVAAYDNIPLPSPALPRLKYQRAGEGPAFIDASCDPRFFQRLILTACNPDADVLGWAQELGLPISESCVADGTTVVAVDIPQGMSPNAIGGEEALGGADKPLTRPRRPKQDSIDFIVEPDYAITVSSEGNGLFPLDQDCTPSNGTFGVEDFCFKPNPETLECLTFDDAPGSEGGEGSSVIITMIDSGVDINSAWNPVWSNHAYRGEQEYKFLVKDGIGYDFIRGDFTPDDEVGHGTATGGTAIGGYKGKAPLTVVHYKIFGDQNLATYFGALVAINSAIDVKSDVINMSWGIIQETPPQALECAIGRAQANNIAIVTSAGNENANLEVFPQWPANFSKSGFKFDEMLTVGSMVYPNYSLDEDPVKVSFSSFSGGIVDVAAYLTSRSPRFNGTGPDDFAFIAGTSISAPIVTGSLAGFLGPNGRSFSEWVRAKTKNSGPLLGENHVKDGLFLPLCDDVLE